MNTTIDDNFLDLAIKRKLYSNKANLKFHLNFLFNKVELQDKKVLDVGGGKGLLTFYAAIKGASKVVCLEPECDGSSKGMIKDFNEIKYKLLSTMPVELLPVTLQDYINNVDDNEFDVIVMHNSINHLNEDACINFRNDENSQKIYEELFTVVYKKLKKGGKMIIADCSNNNFFNAIGIKNFLVPTIEWHKHQKPSTWISLLEGIGFKNPKLEWKTPNSFGKIGKVLMDNPIISYMTNSSFKFTMEK